MATPPTVTVNRADLEAIVQEIIDLIDTADRVAAIEDQKADQEKEG